LINGWINLDKPVGMSSAAVVAKVKWLLYQLSQENTVKKKIKIGHAGTLDPLASGILPLALGEATKTVQYMMDAAKAYEFTVSWGQERATDDVEGEVIHSSDKRPAIAEILTILPQFIGDIAQTPPNYSAIKLGGKRAYELSRSGKDVEIKSRQVFVKSLEITCHPALVAGSGVRTSDSNNNPDPAIRRGDTQETTSFLCHCGKGTYIRSLARDMGRILGCYGYISELRRIKVGNFMLASAISLENLEKMVHKGNLNFLQSVESSLDDILAWEVNSTQATDLRHGKTIIIPELSGRGEGFLSLMRYDGKAVAICELAAGVMKPLRVFNL